MYGKPGVTPGYDRSAAEQVDDAPASKTHVDGKDEAGNTVAARAGPGVTLAALGVPDSGGDGSLGSPLKRPGSGTSAVTMNARAGAAFRRRHIR